MYYSFMLQNDSGISSVCGQELEELGDEPLSVSRQQRRQGTGAGVLSQRVCTAQNTKNEETEVFTAHASLHTGPLERPIHTHTNALRTGAGSEGGFKNTHTPAWPASHRRRELYHTHTYIRPSKMAVVIKKSYIIREKHSICMAYVRLMLILT